LSVQLVSKISNFYPDPPTSQTDGRHAISIQRYALVHRAVKIKSMNTCDLSGTIMVVLVADVSSQNRQSTVRQNPIEITD